MGTNQNPGFLFLLILQDETIRGMSLDKLRHVFDNERRQGNSKGPDKQIRKLFDARARQETHSAFELIGRTAYLRILCTSVSPRSVLRSIHRPTTAPQRHRVSRQLSLC
jgi:hypothetical protein